MIKLFINGQRLVAEYPLIVSDTIDYIEVNAVFRTQDWDGATKWLHLSNGIDEFNVLFNNDTITKDGHFNLTDGTWKAFVHGTVNNTRITTNEIEIKVAKTGIIDGEPLPDIPPSAGEQILQIAQDAVTIAESVREDADNGLFNGEKGEKGDTGDKGDIGEKGDQGVPGFSPIATVAETDTGVSFSVTDQNGTTTVNMDRPADEWITIADITTTEEVCYVYFDLPCECKEVVAKVISPSTLTGGFWTSTTEALWSGTASGVNVVSWQDTKEITTIYKVYFSLSINEQMPCALRKET